jgi:hypothetical protein
MVECSQRKGDFMTTAERARMIQDLNADLAKGRRAQRRTDRAMLVAGAVSCAGCLSMAFAPVIGGAVMLLGLCVFMAIASW